MVEYKTCLLLPELISFKNSMGQMANGKWKNIARYTILVEQLSMVTNSFYNKPFNYFVNYAQTIQTAQTEE